MSIDEGTPEFDHGARRLQGAMLEHPNLAIERMPGLSYALNRFIAEAPAAPCFAHRAPFRRRNRRGSRNDAVSGD